MYNAYDHVHAAVRATVCLSHVASPSPERLCRIFLRLVAGALSSFGCSSVAVKVPDGHNRDQRSPATEATASYQSPQATVGFLRVHSMKSVFTESQPPLQIPKFIH
jgi:hypothetical protein